MSPAVEDVHEVRSRAVGGIVLMLSAGFVVRVLLDGVTVAM